MKLAKTLAFTLLFSLALSGFALADVAGMGWIIGIGLLMYGLIAAVIITAVVLIIKLVIRLVKKRKGEGGTE